MLCGNFLFQVGPSWDNTNSISSSVFGISWECMTPTGIPSAPPAPQAGSRGPQLSRKLRIPGISCRLSKNSKEKIYCILKYFY